jgi:hypothetical protein
MIIRGVKQVRTGGNRYSAVEYDNNGNIILQTKAARKARAEARKKQEVKKTLRKCTALTKKKKPCPNKVEAWRNADLCHVHDPNGKFRQQIQIKKRIYKETNNKQLAKEAIANNNRWRPLTNKYENSCVVCNAIMYPGEKILWNIKTKQVKHVTH